jgi:methyl-accepting chemotaxis protein
MIDESREQAEDVSAEIQNIAAANEEQTAKVQDIKNAVERLNQGE